MADRPVTDDPDQPMPADTAPGLSAIPEGRARPLFQEMTELVVQALAARDWSRRGIPLVLAQDEARSSNDAEINKWRASANRAISHWNTFTLIAIYGGLEDLVESVGKGLREPTIQTNPAKRQKMLENNRLRLNELKSEGQHTPEKAQILTRLSKDLAGYFLDSPSQAPDKALPVADRWEDFLRKVHLRPLLNRPLPDDLKLTLNEFGAVRNVIIHRMGRIDSDALQQVTQGPWTEVDEEVIIDDSLYHTYVAALITYHRELLDRIRKYLYDIDPSANLSTWRQNIPFF